MRRPAHHGSWSRGSWGWERWHRSFAITSSLIPLMILFGGHGRHVSGGKLRLLVIAGAAAALLCLVLVTRRPVSRRGRRVPLGASMVLPAIVLFL